MIGYPAFDGRKGARVQNEVFRGLYTVKCLQPGLLKPRAVANSYGNALDTVTHDASTHGGNSGSCVLDVTNGKVVALHFAGRNKATNYAVPTFELSCDARIDALMLEFGKDATSDVEDPNPWQTFWDGPEARSAVPVTVLRSPAPRAPSPSPTR